MSAADALPFGGERPEPGAAASYVLAAAVHLVLLAILLIGVRWQSHPPAAMTVELWSAPVAEVPPPPKPAPPVVEKPLPPKPVAAPEPPKPEPVIEKPDIAIKAPPKPKPVAKPKPPPPRPAAKPKPPQPSAREHEIQRQRQEELAHAKATLAAEEERRKIQEQLAREAAVARDRAMATWVDRVRAKIRSNIVLPPALEGNPEAVFDVVQIPTGEVINVQLRKSSGYGSYDAAVERAIRKSSPLPRPERPGLFARELRLHFWPKEPSE